MQVDNYLLWRNLQTLDIKINIFMLYYWYSALGCISRFVTFKQISQPRKISKYHQDKILSNGRLVPLDGEIHNEQPNIWIAGSRQDHKVSRWTITITTSQSSHRLELYLFGNLIFKSLFLPLNLRDITSNLPMIQISI